MFGSRPRHKFAARIALIGTALFVVSARPAFGVFVADEPEFGPSAGGGSITVKASATARTSRASSLTVAQPGGLVGDGLIGVGTGRLRPGGPPPPPRGGARVRRDSNIGGAALSQALYVKVVAGFEPSSYTWRFSSAVGATAGITAFGGVDLASPLGPDDGEYSANPKLIAAPSLTTRVDGSLVLGWYGNSANTSVAPPTNMLESFAVSRAPGEHASTS